jgi:cytidyltransferase-like protein
MNLRPVAVLGGTFDPVHLGHLQVARHILESLQLEQVLLMLAARPPHKNIGDLSPAEDRLAMLRLAVEEEPGLEVSTLEIDHGAICYTIDTLRALRRESPGTEPLFVLGMDALLVVSPEHGRIFREAGWDRDRLTARINDLTTRPGAELVRGAGGIAEGLPEAFAGSDLPKFGPDGLLLAYAGGGAGLFSAIIGGWINQTAGGSTPVTVEVGA